MTRSQKKRRRVKYSSLLEELKCKFCCLPLPYLQFLATPFSFMIFSSILAILQGSYYTYLISMVTTVERRFALQSKTSGVILLADNFAPILLGAVIGYCSGKGHRPRWVGFGMLSVAFSCFLAAMPYFIYGPAHTEEIDNLAKSSNGTDKVLCQADHSNGANECASGRESSNVAFWLLFLGNFLNGFGGTVLYSAVLTYLDDGIKKESSPLYMTVVGCFRGIGPALGFLMAEGVLKINENPFYKPDFDKNDARWIGAWWMGFLFLAALLAVFSFLIMCFPRTLTVDRIGGKTELSIEDALKTFLKLTRNPILVCQTLGQTIRWFGLLGHFTFVMKYTEQVYKITPDIASLYIGTLPIAVSLLFQLSGGFAIWFVKPRPKILTGLVAFLGLLCSLTLLSSLFLQCESAKYTMETTLQKGEDLFNSCNENCSCSFDTYSPVCHEESQITYFSPCFAGCSTFNMTNSTCECLIGEKGAYFEGIATKGRCGDTCPNFGIYVFIVCLSFSLVFFTQAGQMLIPMRCVDMEDKTYSLGIISGIMALFAFLPYPLVYGAIVDSTCLVWGKKCGDTGNCWVYDNDKLRDYLHGVSGVLMLIGAMFDFVVFFLSGRLQNFYGEEEQQQRQRVRKPSQHSLPENTGMRTLDKQDIIHMVPLDDRASYLKHSGHPVERESMFPSDNTQSEA